VRPTAVIDKLAHVASHVGMRVLVGHALGHGHREGRELLQQAATGAAAADLARAAVRKKRSSVEAATGPSGATDEKP
jgi:hypothetical protein